VVPNYELMLRLKAKGPHIYILPLTVIVILSRSLSFNENGFKIV